MKPFHLMILCLLAIVVSFQFIVYSSMVPQIMEDLGITTLQTGLLSSLFFIGLTVASVFGGIFTDRFGVHQTFTVAGGLLALSIVMMPLVANYWWILLFRCLAGFGAGAAFIVGARLAKTPVELGLYGSCMLAGPALSLLLSSWLLPLYGWPQTLLLFGLLSTILLVFIYAVEIRFHGTKHDVAGARLYGQKIPKSIWGLGLCNMGTFATGNAVVGWLPVYFVHIYGFSMAHSAFLAALPLFFGILLRLFGGWLLHLYRDETIIKISTGLITLALFLLAWPGRNLAFALLCLLLFSIGMSLPYAAIFHAAGQTKTQPATAQGIVSACSAPALLFAPPTIGWLMKVASFSTAFLVVGVCFCSLSFLASWFIVPLNDRQSRDILQPVLPLPAKQKLHG